MESSYGKITIITRQRHPVVFLRSMCKCWRHMLYCAPPQLSGVAPTTSSKLEGNIWNLWVCPGICQPSALCQSRFCCARFCHSINASSFQPFSKTTKSTARWRLEGIKYFNIVCLKKRVKMIFSWRRRSSKVIAVIKLLLSCSFLCKNIYKKYIS